MKNVLRRGGQWVFLLLLALWGVHLAHAQSSADTAFLSTLGELRDASFPDKEEIIDHLSQSGHPSVQAALTALLEDRLYFRNDDQKVFLVKSAADQNSTTLDLIDPLTLKAAGSASIDNLTEIGTNNHLRRVLQTTLARFGLSSPDASVRLDAVQDIEQDLDESNVQLLRDRTRRGNEFQGEERNCNRSGARCAGWLRRAGASFRDIHASQQPPPGRAE